MAGTGHGGRGQEDGKLGPDYKRLDLPEAKYGRF